LLCPFKNAVAAAWRHKARSEIIRILNCWRLTLAVYTILAKLALLCSFKNAVTAHLSGFAESRIVLVWNHASSTLTGVRVTVARKCGLALFSGISDIVAAGARALTWIAHNAISTPMTGW